MGKPASVDAYIAGFPPDIAAILERLRDTIRAAAPDAEEAVKYSMASFLLDGAPVIYLAGWKAHAGLYPVHKQKPALEAKIAPYRAAKDTLQLRYRDPIPYDLVARIVAARVTELRRA